MKSTVLLLLILSLLGPMIYCVLTRNNDAISKPANDVPIDLRRIDRNPVLVQDLNQQRNTYGSDPNWILENDGIIYFCASDGVHGGELWRSDGTDGGTWLVQDNFAGAVGGSCAYLTSMNNVLYFVASSPYGSDLWGSDGTPMGTRLVMDTFPREGNFSPHYLTVGDNLLFFQARNDQHCLD